MQVPPSYWSIHHAFARSLAPPDVKAVRSDSGGKRRSAPCPPSRLTTSALGHQCDDCLPSPGRTRKTQEHEFTKPDSVFLGQVRHESAPRTHNAHAAGAAEVRGDNQQIIFDCILQQRTSNARSFEHIDG